MLFNIRTSEANKAVVQELTYKLGLSYENTVSRIALAYSLSKRVKLSLASDLRDGKGKEYKEDILLGRMRDTYVALISQHYGLHRSDPDLPKYMKMHVDHGLESLHRIFRENPSYQGIDFLLTQVESGIGYLMDSEVPEGAVPIMGSRASKEPYFQPIKLSVGSTLDGSSAHFELNNTAIHNNAHIAVAGNSGTGKTYFANRLLEQLVAETKGQVNFIFLDFKGINEEDELKNRSFFEKTSTLLVKAPDKSFPINPLSFIDNVNEKNRIMGINKLVDIMTGFSKIGKVQQQILKESIREAFAAQKGGTYPSFQEINDLVREKEDGKRSTLSELVEQLSELELFKKEADRNNEFIQKNHYLSLPGSLSSSIRVTAVFLIVNYLYNIFMNMDNAPIEQGMQGMRYMIVIDEAHNVFKEKKAHEILERLLREIRSKGVSIMLLSQGIEEFNQPDFDFSSMCETVFLFDIKNKTDLKMIQKFMGVGDKDLPKLKTNMEKIQKYQMVTNLREMNNISLMQSQK